MSFLSGQTSLDSRFASESFFGAILGSKVGFESGYVKAI